MMNNEKNMLTLFLLSKYKKQFFIEIFRQNLTMLVSIIFYFIKGVKINLICRVWSVKYLRISVSKFVVGIWYFDAHEINI